MIPSHSHKKALTSSQAIWWCCCEIYGWAGRQQEGNEGETRLTDFQFRCHNTWTPAWKTLGWLESSRFLFWNRYDAIIIANLMITITRCLTSMTASSTWWLFLGINVTSALSGAWRVWQRPAATWSGSFCTPCMSAGETIKQSNDYTVIW